MSELAPPTAPPPPPPNNVPNNLHQKQHAILYMAIASALHFAGYEYVRSATITLFTSHQSGFSNPAAMPAATGLVAPCSIILLWWYTGIVDSQGPKVALLKSTTFFTMVCVLGGIIIYVLDTTTTANTHHFLLPLRISQVTSTLLFVSQNALVQLLFTQHWAFLGSMATTNNHKSWFAPVAGIGSVSSTLAASTVGLLAKHLHLWGLLMAAAVLIGGSGICANQAYTIAEQYDFAPSRESTSTATTKQIPHSTPNTSRLQHARQLFKRVPILGALFMEVLSCQCLSSLISFLFILQVKESLPDDQERASWTGHVYAWINGASGVLQFAVIPWCVTMGLDPRFLWPVMPAAMMLVCCCILSNPSLVTIAGAFLIMKTLEYSLRGVANELVFASLDYESRFFGKEIIGLFGNRFGKSGMAVALSILANTVTVQQVTATASLFSLVWFIVSIHVVILILSDMKVPNTVQTTQREKAD